MENQTNLINLIFNLILLSLNLFNKYIKMEKKLTSVIDVPRQTGQIDLFGIDKYKDALVEFIGTTTTPITVAIQGFN